MNSLIQAAPGLADMLGALRMKGVRLWADNGRLCYQASRGALSREDLEALARFKGEILALLTGAQSVTVQIKPRASIECVPLTFSQLAHWYRYRLSERPHLRQIAAAIRLTGSLDLQALRDSVDQIILRHEALRTRIVLVDGEPMQTVDRPNHLEFQVEDLRAVADEQRETEARQRIERFIAEPVHVTVGPLLALRLLRLRPDEHVLVVAMEHMISDGVSLNILLQDLLTAYEQTAASQPVSLPALPLQFADYAVWLRDPQQQAWIEEHALYWRRRLTPSGRARLPEDAKLTDHDRRGWSAVPIDIPKELQARLMQWCRSSAVTLPASVFAAYAAHVMRWCDARKTVMRYVTDGRIAPTLQGTLGYFAFLLFVRVERREGDRFLDLVQQVTEEYCTALERPHMGSIEAQATLPEFARGWGFNWVPHTRDSSGSDARRSKASLRQAPVMFEHPLLSNLEQDIEPFALFYEGAEGISGAVHYPRNRFSDQTMKRLTGDFVRFIDAVIAQPGSRG